MFDSISTISVKARITVAIIVIFVLVLILQFIQQTPEKFAAASGTKHVYPIYFKPYSFRKLNYYDYPYWNTTTRNMSYDLRGDPLVIPRDYVGPWNISPHYPIQNKPLWMVS